MLLHAGRDREDVGVEDDVFRREVEGFGQQRVAALADLELALDGIGLAVLVERHDDHGGAVAAHLAGMLQEGFLALLEADRVDHALALNALETGLDDRPFGRVDHDRHFGDVGLGRDQIEKVDHGIFGIEHALVHVDVDDLGAVLDLLARDVETGIVIVRRDQLAELGRARDIGPLADIHEAELGRRGQRFEAGQPQMRIGSGHRARRLAFHGLRNGADVVGRGAAAPAEHVDQAAVGELGKQRGCGLRRLVIFAELVGQAGIGIGADQGVGQERDVVDMLAHLLGAERAVEPDRERLGMAHRMPEGFGRLARERAAGQVGDGAGDHDRQFDAEIVERFQDRIDRRLGVQRVEDGLDQKQVRPALDQAACRLTVGLCKIVECRRAVGGVADVRRDRRGLVGRPDGAGDETPASRLLRHHPVAGLARAAGARHVQLMGDLGHAVVVLGNRRGGKGVGLDDVRAGEQVVLVDLPDGVGLGQHQKVVVALQVLRPVGEPLASEVRFLQLQVLDLRPHGTVDDDDPFSRNRPDRLGHGRGIHVENFGHAALRRMKTPSSR